MQLIVPPLPRVVNLKFEEYDVYIGRAGKGQDGYFGNPFRADDRGLQRALDQYRAYFEKRIVEDFEFRRRVVGLMGRRLGCFCKPKPCHGDIIVEWLRRNAR